MKDWSKIRGKFTLRDHIDLLCGLAAAIVCVPILLYLLRPWATRRDKLFGYLDAPSLILYYQQFFPSKKPDAAKVQDEFRRDFSRTYGRQYYLIPIVLLWLLTSVSAFLAARTLQVWQKVSPDKYAAPWIVLSAIAGGFAWVISDTIGRFRRRDFTVSDVYNWLFRILIAAPFGWAFAQVTKDDIGVPLAFLLGAFPTGTLFTIARRLTATRLGISDDPATGDLELEKLQSITKTNAERFYDEGISKIVQLAYADPIDLTIRTNFDFNYVIDCSSQALLWIYFRGQDEYVGALFSARRARGLLLPGHVDGPPDLSASHGHAHGLGGILESSTGRGSNDTRGGWGGPIQQIYFFGLALNPVECRSWSLEHPKRFVLGLL